LSTYLIQHHIVTASQGESLSSTLFAQAINALPGVAALAWSMWQKYGARLKLVTALTMPPGTTIAQVEQKIASGAPLPPPDLSKTAVPLAAVAKLALVLVLLGGLTACASVPVKQKATQTLTTAETLLGQAQDTERALCSLTQNPAEPITHCDNPVANLVGLTDATHQQIARAFFVAFNDQSKAATALLAWQAGQPVPTSLTQLVADVTATLSVVKSLSSNGPVNQTISTLQAVLSNLGTIIAQLEGQ
jgi:hypothetical protein